MARREGPAGEARLDVKSHYLTIPTRTVELNLNSVGAPPGAVRDLMRVLVELWALPGTDGGLPIGPEASAPLGTLVLLPVDRLIGRLGFREYRWMDDTTVFLADEVHFDALLEVVEAQLQSNGQCLNADKCEFVPAGEAVDGSVSGVGGYRMLAEDPLEALEIHAFLGEPRGLTKALGLLRVRGDNAGVAVLRANRWIIERFPKQVGTYLTAVQKTVDSWDWVLDFLQEPTSRLNAAAQLHMARVPLRSAVPPSTAVSMFAKAQGLSRARFGPLANQLFVLAGRSGEREHVRRRRALELAEDLGELDARRSLLSAFAGGGVNRVGRAGLRFLEAHEPELAMTVDWALAA